MLMRVWLKTQPLQQWNVAREFRRRLKLIMKEKGIEIGTPQQFLPFRDPLALDGSLAKSDRSCNSRSSS
jgi:small conductance mechanosensitive channel